MAPYVEEPESLATVPKPDVGSGSVMSLESSKKEKIRVQFEFVPEALARLDALKETTGAPTRAETLRRALRFYEWLVNEAMRGDTILTLDKDNEVVSQFPADFLMQ
jgi:hypothetical protein